MIYSNTILSYAQNPPNYGIIKDAEVILEAENPSCGDSLKIYLKLSGNKIIDAKFVGDGCAISKASASMALEDIINLNAKDIPNISTKDIDQKLGFKINKARENCAYLVLNAFKNLPH